MAKGAPIGNQFGLALDNPKIRQKAFKSFCDHLAKGKRVDSWYFDEDDYLCCFKTMIKYIEANPNEFPTIKRDIAFAQGYQAWESVVEESAKGKNKNANTASLQMLMRNKYGWDKVQDKDAHSDQKVTPQQITDVINAAK